MRDSCSLLPTKRMLAVLLAAVIAGVVGVAYASPDDANDPGNSSASGQVSEGVSSSLVIAGETQYDTSAEQAVLAFPDGSSYAIVASGDIPVDALAATSLAGALECPILLTNKDELPESVSLALSTLKVGSVVIVGGPVVVGSSVEEAIKAKGISVERLYGESQYDTQMKIYGYGEERGFWSGSDTLIVASGNFVSAADALSASPIAYKLKAPVILVDKNGDIPAEAVRKLAGQSQYSRALIVGGTAVVSDVSYGYMAALTMLNSGEENVIRLAGETLYDTSAAVAKWATEQGILAWDGLAFATGRTPFDSLGGSVFQGVSGSVLLLVDPNSLIGLDVVVNCAESLRLVVFFGGEAVMPASLRDVICERLPLDLVEDGEGAEAPGLGTPPAGNQGEGDGSIETEELVEGDVPGGESVDQGSAPESNDTNGNDIETPDDSQGGVA